MSQVLTFQSQQLRSIVENEQIWFVAKDVCSALSISWSSATLKPVPGEWKGVMNFITPSSGQRGGGRQRLSVISEQGVYMLAFRSNKESALALTRWVAGEVLPTIRKTGKYEAPQPLALPAAEADIRRQIDSLYFRLKTVTREAFDIQRDIFSLVRQSMGPCMRTLDRRRTAALKAYATHESLSYAHDRTLEALVANAETLMVIEDMA